MKEPEHILLLTGLAEVNQKVRGVQSVLKEFKAERDTILNSLLSLAQDTKAGQGRLPLKGGRKEPQ